MVRFQPESLGWNDNALSTRPCTNFVISRKTTKIAPKANKSGHDNILGKLPQAHKKKLCKKSDIFPFSLECYSEFHTVQCSGVTRSRMLQNNRHSSCKNKITVNPRFELVKAVVIGKTSYMSVPLSSSSREEPTRMELTIHQ